MKPQFQVREPEGPLLLATGPGAGSRCAIGITIVAGLSASTLFRLLVLPIVYTFLATDRARAARQPAQAPAAAVAHSDD